MADQGQFDYPSNLVIQREAGGPRGDDPTGEPESLAGRISMKEMGKYAAREKPKKADKQKIEQQKINYQKNQSVLNPTKKTKIPTIKGQSVLNVQIQEDLLYKPKTKENRAFYEALLYQIQQILGDESEETLRSAADDILVKLKADSYKDQEKKSMIEELTGKISQEQFSDLLSIAKAITDYTIEAEENIDAYGEELRLGVVFDEDQMDQEDEEYQEQEQAEKGDDEEEEEDEEKNALAMKGEDQFEEIEEDEYDIDVAKIDGYWLQSELNKHFEDPVIAQKLEQDVLNLLKLESEIECENQLVMLLNYDKFDLVKLLLKNRHKIYFCTIIGQAENEEEKQQILQEMRSSVAGESILEQLELIKIRKDKEFENIKQVRKEAAQLSRQARKEAKEQDNEFILEAVRIRDEDFSKMHKKVLDLESIAFQQAGHFMSNEKCQLPQGSYRLQKKGYDEVYVPAKINKDPPKALKKIKDLPEWTQDCFQNIKELNPIQSEVFDTAFGSPENMLVCAPTGAGKTNVALLTMLQVIKQYLRKNGTIDTSKFKMVYIAPMKALAAELVGNFSKRLEPLKLVVRELTGDMQLSKQQIEETQLIVATPEKWDIITRKSGEKTYTELVKLLIIDEIHLLHDLRGPVLESLVARTIRMIESTQELIRIVGLSATLPNYGDVAAFLRVKPEKGLFFFDNTFRPVPLEQQYIGITEKKGVRRMMLTNEILYDKVIERAGKYQMIIFVHSRRETSKTAKWLKEMAYSKDELGKFLKEDSKSQTILQSETENVKNQELKSLLPFGFAIHHAGLHRLDRTLVEDLFADKLIQVLVSTSTLAWGVNLPAHTVIIKGTQVYSPEQGKWIELSAQDILQMFGRAGRPGYDKKGEGIIITGYQELKYYLSLLNQQLPIESQFISQLADQLNAEIALGSVSNTKDAVNWLGYTYLYVRMLRQPHTYGIQTEEAQNDPLLIKRRAELVHTAAILLDKNNLIKYDKKSGSLQSSALGKIASHYYIKHPSITVYNEQIRPHMGLIELLKVFSLSNEFHLIPVREEEKSELLRLVESVPLPVKGSQSDPTTKINVLLQAYISRLKFDGFALNADMVYVTQSAGRILRSLFEIFLRKGWAQPAEYALSLCKMVERRMWSCMTPLRQFKGLPEEILRRIEKKEQFTWEHFYSMSPQQIGELVKFPKLGRLLHRFIHQFPRVELSAYVQPITRSCLRVDLSITPDFQWEPQIHGKAEPFWLFVQDCDCETLLYAESFVLKQNQAQERQERTFEFVVPILEPLHPVYYIKVISDRWLQCEASLPVSFRNLILPSKFPSPTELLDLQRLPLSALKNTKAEKIFEEMEIKEFNSIQTQVFQSIYLHDDSVFLGSSTGSGKTVIAILAILRAFKSNPSEKIVYVAPFESICKIKAEKFQELFEDLFQKKVAMLTGQAQSDQKLLESMDILVSTPEHFDILSRRWKQRKALQKVALVILDELHLLGDCNSALEVVGSRMRYLAAQFERKIRIVGLASPVANYKDLADWLGAPSSSTFNFHPSVRPVPLEIAIQGFDQNHVQARLLSMQKSVYSGISQHAKDQPVLVFVSDRKQVRLTSLDLVTLAHGDNEPHRFLQIPLEKLQQFLQDIEEHNLRHVLQYGIGYIYEGQLPKDRKLVEQLFSAGAIQIMVCTHKLCWEIQVSAHCVMVVDTQKYDGQEKRYVDYTIPDMLQIMGFATLGDHAKCLIFAHTPKKELYKKFLCEPYPVESHLTFFISDNLNAEIVAKTIENKQECIDWITWTFMYRRLQQNPNYYNLHEVSATHINDFLSELIETSLEELEKAKCISIEDDIELHPLNLGIIACYYYIRYSTIEHFTSSLTSSSKLRQILESLSSSSEFQVISIRHKEEHLLKALSTELPYKIEQGKFNQPELKTFILLQAHFDRKTLSPDFSYDQQIILENTIRLIQAMVDVLSSNCWLKPCILAMRLSQMVVQALWPQDSPLLQLPYFDKNLVQKFKNNQIEDIADFMNMEDDERSNLLDMPQEKVFEIAEFCNNYPSINLEIINPDSELYSGEPVSIKVKLTREGEDMPDFVTAPYFPKPKEEQWWVVLGDNKTNHLYAIKRVTLVKNLNVDLKFVAPEPGDYEFNLYLISDSYFGCDQGDKINLKIQENDNIEEEEDDEDNQMNNEEEA